PVVSQKPNSAIVAGTVENIVAKLDGTNNHHAIMLASHYDSVPNSFGANDDGFGVSVMLETLRALKTRGQLRNDVIFLFSDGEEVGLLGAKAFVDQHPWARNVGLVLNFDARGNSGPVVMFETSANNQDLIYEFAKAVPRPVANSLSSEIYRRLPNSTDLNVFKQAGMPGLNFAYIKGLNHYHTYMDSLGEVDESSIQHGGSYALALATHFGNLDSITQSKGNAVYFDLLGRAFFHYSVRWVLPLFVFVGLLLAATVVLGFKRGRLTIRGVGFGFIAFISTLVIAWLAGTGLWRLMQTIYGERTWVLQNDSYHSQIYLISFVALTLALASSLYLLVFKRVSAPNLTMGALLGLFVLSVPVNLYLPGASYLFVWSLLFSTIALATIFISRNQNTVSIKQTVVFLVCAIPGVLLFVPVIYLVYTAVTLAAAGILMVMVALLLATLIPHLRLMSTSRTWLVPTLAAIAGVGFFIAGIVTPVYRHDQPKSNNIFYALNADSGKAAWASVDPRPDEWTTQFLSRQPERGSMADYIPLRYDRFLKSEAPEASLPAPQIALVSDTRTDDGRTIKVRVTSPRQAPSISLSADPGTEIVSSDIAGKNIPTATGERWALNYFALPQNGVEISLHTKSGGAVKIRAVDQSYELPVLPEHPFTARPNSLIPKPFTYSDST
ncbi:MAG TPA: M20/M25/M40 family metallo-hydrolase, partial [Pyrinomonadaceae bacterium]|nr:M20/M25/M40 family metallo-hydrolase [Pyrinomonadaceae bacterium]